MACISRIFPNLKTSWQPLFNRPLLEGILCTFNTPSQPLHQKNRPRLRLPYFFGKFGYSIDRKQAIIVTMPPSKCSCQFWDSLPGLQGDDAPNQRRVASKAMEAEQSFQSLRGRRRQRRVARATSGVLSRCSTRTRNGSLRVEVESQGLCRSPSSPCHGSTTKQQKRLHRCVTCHSQ